MLRIDHIYVKRDSDSRVKLSRLQQIVENKLKSAASATKFRTIQDDVKLEVILGTPISIQTANQIFKIFSTERIKIKKVVWEEEKIGPFDRGNLEITIS